MLWERTRESAHSGKRKQNVNMAKKIRKCSGQESGVRHALSLITPEKRAYYWLDSFRAMEILPGNIGLMVYCHAYECFIIFQLFSSRRRTMVRVEGYTK